MISHVPVGRGPQAERWEGPVWSRTWDLAWYMGSGRSGHCRWRGGLLHTGPVLPPSQDVRLNKVTGLRVELGPRVTRLQWHLHQGRAWGLQAR